MDLSKAFIGALVRHVISAASGYLLAKGLIDEELHGRLIAEGTTLVVAAVFAFLTTYGLSMWNKVVAKVREKVALETEPGKGVAEVAAKADAMPITAKIKAATSPGTTRIPKEFR